MNRVARAKWIASFDMEDLVSSILKTSLLVSIGCVMAGLVFQRMSPGGAVGEDRLQGTNVLHFVLADRYRLTSPPLWPGLLIHLGIAVLMVSPYLRVVSSLFYFACVERSWKHALLTSIVAATLTYILLFG